MKKTILFLAGLLFAIAAPAQEKNALIEGNGNIAKEKREVAAYTKISVTGPFKVKLVSGEPGTLNLKGSKNLLDIITTEVKDGTLVITTANNQIIKDGKKSKVAIEVPFKYLDEISLIGAGSIVSSKSITCEIKTTIDGPGTIRFQVHNKNVDACVLGSGTIDIYGTTTSFSCKVIGSGTVKAMKLEADAVAATISGTGSAKVNSCKTLKGRIDGSGAIGFTGNPESTDLKMIGPGVYTTY